jgi:hypothetical protein
MLDWIQTNQTLLWWLAAASAVTFVGTLIAVPWLIVRIPADYFANTCRHRTPWDKLHPVARIVVLILKNLLGVIFIAAGIAMLVLPGQGLLTILLGVILLNFPGKFAFERWLVTRRPILRSVNWLRRRARRPELTLDHEAARLGA